MLFDRTGRNLNPPDVAAPSPEGIQNQFERILSSDTFVHSPQLCRFLRYIVEQEIAGKGDELKEYTLGVQVFRKDESFDPRIDTVVRTEARRLRHKLGEYYQAEGRNDSIEILLPKGSYRASFRARAGAALPGPSPSVTHRHQRVLWAAGALSVITGVVVYWLAVRAHKPDHALGRAPSIAVLPLENLSTDPEQEYFSDGITDALITDLAKIRGLRVISRTSVLQFKKTKKPIPEIAGQLGVEYVVEGTILRAGDRVRITAQLIAIPNERHLWAESYERAGSDVLAVQGEIARAIAGQVNIHLTPQEHARLASRPVSPDAYNNYLKGRFEWHTRDVDRLRKSIEYFNQAVEKEPGYALAYAGLADSYSVLSERSLGPPRRDLQARSCGAAKKAIQLDENLGEAYASLTECEKDWDWQARERHYRRVVELSPGYASGHQWLGQLLMLTGRSDEGLSEVRRAAEVDPLSPAASSTLGWALYMARRYDQAIGQFRQTIEMYPDFVGAYLHLGMAYTAKGMSREAMEVLEKAMKLTGGAPPVASLLAHAHAAAGDKSEALRLLGEFKKRPDITPAVMALVYLDVGDKHHAIEWLEKGYEQNSQYMEDLKVEPLYDNIRGDPRFIGILRKMNLAN